MLQQVDSIELWRETGNGEGFAIQSARKLISLHNVPGLQKNWPPAMTSQDHETTDTDAPTSIDLTVQLACLNWNPPQNRFRFEPFAK